MIIRTSFAIALALGALPLSAMEPALPSATLKQSPHAAELSVAPVDVRALIDEDSKAQGRPMRYGMPQRIDRPLLDNGRAVLGEWQTLKDGQLLWSAQIESEGAVSLDLHFSRFVLPASAELFLANEAGDYVLGPIRGSDALVDQQYYTALIPGDSMRVEVVVPASDRDAVDLDLASVTYGYRGLFGRSDHPDAIRSGACNVDVACPLGDDWQDQIAGVGQYIFQDGGSFVCSGTLIGNTAGTAIPYFLTANHCVGNNTVANTMRVYWNYESPTCRTPGSGASGSPLPRPATFNNGATLRATYGSTDVTLVEMNAAVPPAETPFYVGWDRRNLGVTGGPAIPSAITIHHPQGHEKRISLESDPVTVTSYLSNTPNASGTHYRIADWDEGTTEGGSSGSSLYNPDKRLIGVLTGGFAACGNNDPDWYGRIYQAWDGGGTNATRLSNWLDPGNTGVETMDGYAGTPLGDADLSIALGATPNPVDIGQTVTFGIDVANDGPDAASGVSVELLLPADLDYDAGTGTGWSCSETGGTVACNLAGDLANGASAATLNVTADVTAEETGTVNVAASVDAATNDANLADNEADVDLEITGEPPLPDCIFADGFEEGGDGSCGAPPNPDIVTIENIDFVPNPDFTGGSIQWVDGTTCNCDTAPFNFNVYGSATTVQFFWPLNTNPNEGGVTLNGSTYAVLGSGDTVGPSSQYLLVTAATATAPWTSPGNVDGYLGFKFDNGGTVNYGYARITTGAGGRPVTILSVTYNSAGDPITIP